MFINEQPIQNGTTGLGKWLEDFNKDLESGKLKDDVCEICNGTGLEEEEMYDCDSDTGYNMVSYKTGKLLPCSNCQ